MRRAKAATMLAVGAVVLAAAAIAAPQSSMSPDGLTPPNTASDGFIAELTPRIDIAASGEFAVPPAPISGDGTVFFSEGSVETLFVLSIPDLPLIDVVPEPPSMALLAAGLAALVLTEGRRHTSVLAAVRSVIRR